MDATDSADRLSRIPLDAEYAAQWGVENLCAGWTPAEIRDAAMICVELAATYNDYVHACESTAVTVAALHLTTPADIAPLFRGMEIQNATWTERLIADADANRRSAIDNVRAAGALLWLAEQREAGAS
ncbi:Uncharacterised protein [Mycobacteroides abscessus subsp. abscessus]|uniref:hypothetical protein n=1 Tax=Mycobacteroides abscessus TaxID=36809 RepID=UPI000927F832|nr:hypothetical protein [Mycobacteroides abscessus]SIC63270.1 Uncharacterised protein [Mycobacteroides abscessus subsp. abscessus]SIG64110.1 Uncharacterised protein [Mycobacteroides abscessus subsp. abscessus]